jgi:hypothetical protein
LFFGNDTEFASAQREGGKKRQNKQTQQIKKIFIIALCFFENIEELILSVKQRNRGREIIF